MHVRACHCRTAARWMFMACPYFTNSIVNKMAKPNAKPSKYSPGLLLKYTFPKLFEWLQSSLEKDMEKLIIASLMCRTCRVQFWCALLMSSREKGMWLKDLQLDVAPQEMLTASKRCFSHRNFNVSVGAKGHCHCQCCRVPSTLPLEILCEDFSDEQELGLDIKLFLLNKQNVYCSVY